MFRLLLLTCLLVSAQTPDTSTLRGQVVDQLVLADQPPGPLQQRLQQA